MNTPMLDERSKSILLAIIDKYIESAEPVGSKTIAKFHPKHLSSATIRNAMAELENNGFLIVLEKDKESFPVEQVQIDKDDFIKTSNEKPGKLCSYGMSYNSESNEYLPIEELKNLIKKL